MRSPANQLTIWLIGPYWLSNSSRQVAPATMGEMMVGSTSSETKIWRPGMLLEKQIGHGEAEHQFERQRDGGDQQRVRQRPPEPRVLEQVGL